VEQLVLTARGARSAHSFHRRGHERGHHKGCFNLPCLKNELKTATKSSRDRGDNPVLRCASHNIIGRSEAAVVTPYAQHKWDREQHQHILHSKSVAAFLPSLNVLTWSKASRLCC